MTRVLLTGAGGFLGGHLLDHILGYTNWDITAVTHHKDIRKCPEGICPKCERVKTFHFADLTERFGVFDYHDYFIAAASEVSVSESIADPVPFVMNNTAIMLNTLELAREVKPKAVLLVSTNEVYGPGMHEEWDQILPGSPYAASKAAQEALAIAYWRSYGVPVIIVNTMNIFGERQDAGRFIPKVVRAISRGEEIGVHAGVRNWIHARNLADGIVFLLKSAPEPDENYPPRFNIAGEDLVTTLTLAKLVAEYLGKPLEYHDEVTDRVGHGDFYALDTGKIAALGWKAPRTLRESLECTVRWLEKHGD